MKIFNRFLTYNFQYISLFSHATFLQGQYKLQIFSYKVSVEKIKQGYGENLLIINYTNYGIHAEEVVSDIVIKKKKY